MICCKHKITHYPRIVKSQSEIKKRPVYEFKKMLRNGQWETYMLQSHGDNDKNKYYGLYKMN